MITDFQAVLVVIATVIYCICFLKSEEFLYLFYDLFPKSKKKARMWFVLFLYVLIPIVYAVLLIPIAPAVVVIMFLISAFSSEDIEIENLSWLFTGYIFLLISALMLAEQYGLID